MKSKMLLALAMCVIVLACCACQPPRQSDQTYTVIARTNDDSELHFYAPVVLQSRGHKYFARCNDNKAGDEKGVTLRCRLHVGMTINCQVYENRDLGYDLICGTKRDKTGKLDTFGENELILIDREEN